VRCEVAFILIRLLRCNPIGTFRKPRSRARTGNRSTLAPDLREFVRVQPDAAALRAFVDFDGSGCGKLSSKHYDVAMVRAVQPDRVVDQLGRELREMGDECIAKRAVRPFEPGELETIKPDTAAVLTDIGADTADLQRRERHR